MTGTFKPVSAALAFRIWRYAEPLGWDCTAAEIADALGEPINRIVAICRHRGWNHKLRKVTRDERTDDWRYSANLFGIIDAGRASPLDRCRRLAEESPE
jgi:predicted secreted protein